MKLNKCFSWLKDKNKLAKIIAVLFISIVVLFVVFSFFSGEKEEKVEYSSEGQQYIANLEKKLVNTLSKVDGAGKVSVVISVESGMETVLAMKTETTIIDGKTVKVETPILVNGKTVVLKELYPKIVGVLIVAEGADNIVVMQKLQSATRSLVDVSVNNIEILSM